MCLLARAGREARRDSARLLDPHRARPVPTLAGDEPAARDARRDALDGGRRPPGPRRRARRRRRIRAGREALRSRRPPTQDRGPPYNMTRFLLVGRQQAEPTGRDKTSVLLVTRDEPGILFRTLGASAERGLDMTKSRAGPRGARLGVRVLRRRRRARARSRRRGRARRGARRLRVGEGARLVSARRVSVVAARHGARRFQSARVATTEPRAGRGLRPESREFPNSVADLATRRALKRRFRADDAHSRMSRRLLLVDADADALRSRGAARPRAGLDRRAGSRRRRRRSPGWAPRRSICA